MIKIKLFKDSRDLYSGYEISGHSGYAEAGHDIICSAVSMLAQNTANSIELLADCRCDLEVSDGYLKFSAYSDEANEQSVQLLFKSFELGIKSVVESYGSKYLSLRVIAEKKIL